MTEESIVAAVRNNQPAVVEALLKKGADANAKDRAGKSVLLLATESSLIKIARLLLHYGADVNQQDKRLESPFLTAGATGKSDFVKLFLENGARFDVYNRYNGTALIPACERAHLEVVRLLANTKGFPIDHVNRLGWTALMEAVVLGNGGPEYVSVVQILVDAGCNVSIPDSKGVSALQHAKTNRYSEIIKVLEKAAKK